MEKPNRVRQLYGYMVCLIAVVVSLISVSGVVSSTLDLSNPLAAGVEYDALDSFDAWLAQRDRSYESASGSRGDTTSVATWEVRFNALRASYVERSTFRARKALTTSLTSLAISIGLFVSHWRWVRRLPGE